MQALDIIYEDNDIILCRKPAGVATQTKRLGQQDMESLLKNYRVKKKEPPYIGVVHRLDQPVEGIMVFAKNQKAAAGLSKQIQQKMIGKHYYAISANTPEEKEGLLEDYLITDKKANVTSVIEPKVEKSSESKHKEQNLLKDAKKAVLEYKIIDEKEGMTLFDIHLHTGRQHQIRVQMSHMGCPLVGDSKYGDANREIVLPVKQDEAALVGNKNSGLALCSYHLSFTHPTTGKPMDFSIKPAGEAFQSFFPME